MSSFSSDGSIRCWMCKKNGENRFFAGYAARKVHEDTVHASKYSLADHANIDTDYSTYAKGFVSTNASFGTKSSGSEYQGNHATYRRKGKLCFKQLENLKKKLSFQEYLTEPNLPFHHLAKCDQWVENGEDVRQYQRESYNVRLEQALREIETKRGFVKQLQADLDRRDITLNEYEARERQLEDQIEASKRDLKNAVHELKRTAGVIEHERDQRMQMQRMLEGRLHSQKLHITRLQEELDNERLVGKQKERDLDELARLERTVRQTEKELALEKRLKDEAKKSQQESQSEVDELIIENEDIRKRFRQCHQDLEQLQDEQRYLIADYNAMMDTKENQELEEQILEAQQRVQDSFNEERVHLAREIERYRKQSECSENKFKQNLAEIEKVRFELANAESYRQDDIDRLLKEKDCLKVDLKGKKARLHSLEAANEKLTSQLNMKERKIRRLEKINCNGEEVDELEVDETTQEKSLVVGQLESKIRELENLIDVKRSCDSCEKKAKAEADLKNAFEENLRIREELQQVKNERHLKSKEDTSLNRKNEELRQSLKKIKKELEEEKKGFQDFLDNFRKDHVQFEICLTEIAEENKDLRGELQKSVDEATCREAEIERLKRENEEILRNKLNFENKQDEFEKVQMELAQQKNQMESILKQKLELEESFEEEKRDLNEKLDQVLEANVEFEQECIAFESTIEEKENQIKSLQEAVKKAAEKNDASVLLENEKRTLVSRLEASRNEIDKSTEKIEQLTKDLELKRKETNKVKDLEQKIEKIEKEKENSEIQATSLAKKIDQLKMELTNAEDSFQREKKELVEKLKQKTKLEEEREKQNLELKREIDLKGMEENDLAEKQRELETAKEELQTAKRNVSTLTDNLKDLENNCNKLKRDLKSKKEEIKQSEAKENDLFKKWKEREKMCSSLERKLENIEDELKESESLRNDSEKQTFDLQSKQLESIRKSEHDLEKAQVKIDELKNLEEKLRKENKQLREELAKCEKDLSPQANLVENGKDMAKELADLRQNLENMKGREKQIQKHNYEMMKKLEGEENLQKCFQEEISKFKAELEAKHTEKKNDESKIEMLKEEIQEWQRKFDDLGSSFADTQANLHIMSEKSAKAARDVKQESKELRKDLEKLQFQVKEKEAENILLQKQNGNYKELSATLEKRNAELKSKNECIQDIDRKNSSLNAEVRKFESIVRELEDKMQMLEEDKETCQQEKNIYESQLEKQREINLVLESTEKALEKAYEDINVLAAEKKELLIKVEELKKTVACENGNGNPMSETTKCSEQTDESYESDFEDDEKSLRSENTGKGDSRSLPNDETSDIEEDIHNENSNELDVNFDDDEDDFWDTVVDRPHKENFEYRFSKTSTSNGGKDSEDLKNAGGLKKDPQNGKALCVENEEVSDDQDNESREQVEAEDVTDTEGEARSMDEENVTEDITVNEDRLLSHIYDLEYFEHVEPLGEDEKEENRAVNGDMEVKDLDRIAISSKQKGETSASKKKDCEAKERDRKSKHVGFADEEDDILSSFVSQQKAKTTKIVTLREKQMANELGLEDDSDIEDLIADIEGSDESDDQVENASPKIVEKSANEKEPNHSDLDSDSETGIKPRKSGLLCNPALSLKPLGRGRLLPPLGAQTLPPLRGSIKPKF